MKKLKEIKKVTDLKYLNMYQNIYSCDGGEEIVYNYASRRDFSNLNANGTKKVDAVRIVPYYKKDGKIFVVLIKEFRHALNQYIFSTPAGLVDEGELTEQSAKRELEEEIGASVISIKSVSKPAYSSAGLTDEMLECFEAEVKLDKEQKLDKNEEITYFDVPLENLLDFIDNNEFCLQSALQLKYFYYKNSK